MAFKLCARKNLGLVCQWQKFQSMATSKSQYLFTPHTPKNSSWSFMKQVYKFNMDPNAHRLQEWPSNSSKIQQLKEIKIITCLSRLSVHGLYVFSVMERSTYFLSPTGTEQTW